MATVDSERKITTSNVLAAGYVAGARLVDFLVDFDNVESDLIATNDLALITFPIGTVVLAAGIEQLKVETVGTTNTLVARVGTTTMSATLTANAAVGTLTAQAAVDTRILAAAADLNILAATATRSTGKVRVFAVVVEATKPQMAAEVDRDTLA